jgi:hypothetical protein
MPVAFKTDHTLVAWSHVKAREAAVPYITSYQNQGKSSRLKKDQCRELFKNLKILPLQSQYILSLLLFVVYNKDKFKLNSDVYNMNTKQKYNLPS